MLAISAAAIILTMTFSLSTGSVFLLLQLLLLCAAYSSCLIYASWIYLFPPVILYCQPVAAMSAAADIATITAATAAVV